MLSYVDTEVDFVDTQAKFCDRFSLQCHLRFRLWGVLSKLLEDQITALKSLQENYVWIHHLAPARGVV